MESEPKKEEQDIGPTALEILDSAIQDLYDEVYHADSLDQLISVVHQALRMISKKLHEADEQFRHVRERVTDLECDDPGIM